MKLTNLFYTGLLASAVLVSCQKDETKKDEHSVKTEENKEGKKRRALDFSPLKTELNLDAEVEKQFDEIVAKYQAIKKENYETAKQSGKVDRVALGIKNEELDKQQAEEMAKILTPEQLEKFNKFVDENSRKRPRYNDELLAKIQNEIGLSDEQMKVVNASNDAFEKAFHDAHDIYHGNRDLAGEYWEKYDVQRKSAIQKALTPEQFAKFEEIVKDVKFMGGKK